MALLTAQQIALAGLDPVFAAADVAGDSFANPNDRIYFHIKNGDASSHTATFNSQRNCDQGFDHDEAVAVPAGAERIVGPFSPGRFNDANGLAQVTYDAVTSVTVGVFQL